MHNLESPCGADLDWDRLYRARGLEVSPNRPYFTGDVFEEVPVTSPGGAARTRTVMIIQHPCAMRGDGVNLVRRLLVVEVRNHPVVMPNNWIGYGKLMPLPELMPSANTGRRNQAGLFDELHCPDHLARRIACLSQLGVNLLLQRWVHHSSRVVVPTSTYHVVTGGVFEEADLIEDWCDERVSASLSPENAAVECVAWLREDVGSGNTRQRELADPQRRSTIRRQAREMTKKLNAG